MAQDNRLVQEFQENGLVFDIGSVGDNPPTGGVSLSGLYGGVMPYRQSPTGGLSDALAPLSGLITPGESDKVNKQPLNRVCLFENEIHSIAQGHWNKQDATTGAWTLVARIDDINVVYNHVGLYPIFDEMTNKRYVVTAYATDSSSFARDWRVLRYDPELNIVETGVAFTSVANSQTALTPTECQVGNIIYFIGRNEASSLLILDGLSMTVSRASFADVVAGGVHRPADLCDYSGQVYMAHKVISGSSGILTISKMIPVPQQVLQLQFEGGMLAANTSLDKPREKCVLFVDNNPTTSSGQLNGLGQPNTPSMWLYYQVDPQIVPVGGGGVGVEGFSVWQLQGDGIGGLSVVQQLDSLAGPYRAGLFENVIPVGNNDQAVISYCDNYPGWFTSTPEKGILTARPFGGEPGQTFRQWDFDPFGGTTPDGGGDIGGPAKVSFSQDKLGGGARWSPAAVSTTTGEDVNIFDIVYTSGSLVNNRTNWRIHYKLMPSTAYHAGTKVNIRWYYDKFHAPNKRCSLVASSDGSLASNQVTDVVMSSGVSYYVDWNFSSNGLQQGQKIYLCGMAFLSSADIGDL